MPNSNEYQTKRLVHLAKNTQGNDYVVGDLHGCIRQLYTALTQLNFDPSRDRLISVGDLVDRGIDNLMALKLINEPWFYAVLGNHEVMHLNQDFDHAVSNGMDWALRFVRDKAKNQPTLDDQTPVYFELLEAFKRFPIAYEIETEHGLMVVLHAEVTPVIQEWSLARDLIEAVKDHQLCKSDFLWGRKRYQVISSYFDPDEYVDGVTYIFTGHTPVNQPTWHGNHLNIDTGLVFGILGRMDLNEEPALTFVNLTQLKQYRFPVKYGDVLDFVVEDL